MVNAAALHADGGRLVRASPDVWLTDHVPPQYLELHPDSVAAAAEWLAALPHGTEVQWGGDTAPVDGRWIDG